jgi:hypothetical protein
MTPFAIHTVYAGCTPDELWVTLRFRSQDSGDDVVHVVCALEADEQDARLGMDRLYLERDDQSRGGYGGADAVRVTASGVDILLNRDGLDRLQFAAPLRLEWPARLKGKAGAMRVFARMTGYACGRVVQVA